MPLEIERKFLIKDDSWKNEASKGTEYSQGYVFSNEIKSVRIRTAGDKGYITIKSRCDDSHTTRLEYEYEIPLMHAKEMLNKICSEGKIEKNRYKIKRDDLTWEIDEFKGDNEGLIIAEVELEDAKREIDIPAWIGEEVTTDSRYYNSCLAKKPFKTFKD